MKIDPSSLLARAPTFSLPPHQISTPIRRLDLGQVIQGRVLAVRGGQVLLSLLGKQIAVESRLPLQVGRVLDLVVRDIQPDRITLQVTHKTEQETSLYHAITDQDLGDLLTSQRLPIDPTNLLIARALIRHSLPITSALVTTVRNGLLLVEARTTEAMDAVISLLLKDLPITPQSLELAMRADLASSPLGAQVQRLSGQLRDLLARIEQGADTAPFRSLVAAVQDILEDLPQITLDRQDPPLPALVLQVIDRIGAPTEQRLVELLLEEPSIASEPERSPLVRTAEKEPGTVGLRDSVHAEVGTADQAASRSDPRRHNDVTSAQEKLLRPAEDHSFPLTHRHRIELLRDFRQQLALLNDELVKSAAALPRQHLASSLLQKLLVTARDLMSTVEAEQLSNAGMPPPTPAQACYVFHLPITVPGRPTETAEVRLYYHKGQSTKRVDPENAHLAFLLEMSHLGSVEVHVDLIKKHLACRIECTNPGAVELFQESSGELHERLRELGYSVDAIRSVVSHPAEAGTASSVVPNLSKIDIRA